MSLLSRLLLGVETGLYLIFFALLLGGSDFIISEEPQERVRRYSRAVEFDYFDWTLDALGLKLGQAALDTPFYFPEPHRREIVSDYLRLMDEILQAEYRLNLVYTDPSVTDPESASADLRAQLDDLYARQDQLSPLAEAVLEAQVSAVLADLDLTTGGQPIPPVLFQVSPLPYHLVISPRDKIQQDAAISLIPDLTVDRQETLEDKVSAGMDVSALVVPVGGIGTYPTMVMRTNSLDWLADTISHEWIHNWLTLRPLGVNYDLSPELRTMNETTASIAGSEIAVLVLLRYYPALAEEYGLRTVSLPSAPLPPGGWPRPVFDFRAEMHATRLHVDELLAAGKIEEAEAYMEARRQVFWENGYIIRKLNQAYFAFYGAYADLPGGAAGEDPVGPAVRLLRGQSDSLTDFLKTIAEMASFEELQKAVSP
ncbi:MAG: hypothetical protein AB1531_02735 [Chloroflexota bacterium]